MLFEFSIIPVSGDTHLSGPIAEAIKIVEGSGLPHKVTPLGTCIEGEWSQVIPLIEKCHQRVRQLAPHVLTEIKIEDDEGSTNKLRRNITSIEEKIGHAVKV